MIKIAYNASDGGFGLSDAAYEAWLDRKGIAWEKFDGEPPPHMSGYYKKGRLGWDGARIYHDEFVRHDPDLIAVIEEFGEAANGRGARLRIREIAVGSQYRIDENGGDESVMTPDDYDWIIAQ